MSVQGVEDKGGGGTEWTREGLGVGLCWLQNTNAGNTILFLEIANICEFCRHAVHDNAFQE